MGLKITGAQFRDFYQNHWPQGYWHEDAEYEIEDEVGKFILAEDAILDVDKLGYLASGTKGDTRSFADAWDDFTGSRPEEEIVTFRVPTAQIEAFLRAASELGLAPIRQAEEAGSPLP